MNRNYRRPVQVLVYLFRVVGADREYLLLHRVPKLGAFWQGVSGATEKGESLVQGAAREVLEETGFRPKKLDSIDYSYSYPVQEKWRKWYGPEPTEIVEHVFVAKVEGGEPALSWEHDDWRWCAPDDASHLLKWPDNIEALKRAEGFLSKR